MATATWNGTVIARSDSTVEVEGNQYFPPASVHSEYLTRTEKHTHCPWKGDASYFTIEVDGDHNENAAWTYPAPKQAAEEIRDHVAFWSGVEVTD